MATLKIGVVGPCASGKSTLIAGLQKRGITVRHIAQEHSYVPYMWKRLANPDLLIFLDASYPITIKRRRLDWSLAEYTEQQKRLLHAKQNADLYINTDLLTPDDVVETVTSFLNKIQRQP